MPPFFALWVAVAGVTAAVGAPAFINRDRPFVWLGAIIIWPITLAFFAGLAVFRAICAVPEIVRGHD